MRVTRDFRYRSHFIQKMKVEVSNISSPINTDDSEDIKLCSSSALIWIILKLGRLNWYMAKEGGKGKGGWVSSLKWRDRVNKKQAYSSFSSA